MRAVRLDLFFNNRFGQTLLQRQDYAVVVARRCPRNSFTLKRVFFGAYRRDFGFCGQDLCAFGTHFGAYRHDCGFCVLVQYPNESQAGLVTSGSSLTSNQKLMHPTMARAFDQVVADVAPYVYHVLSGRRDLLHLAHDIDATIAVDNSPQNQNAQAAVYGVNAIPRHRLDRTVDRYPCEPMVAGVQRVCQRDWREALAACDGIDCASVFTSITRPRGVSLY